MKAANSNMLDPDDPSTPMCGYLPAVKDETEADVLIATAAAFTETMLTRGTGKDRRDRIVMVEEAPAATHPLPVTSYDTTEWLTACDLAIRQLAPQVQPDDSVLTALEEAKRAIKELSNMLLDGTLDRRRVVDIGKALATMEKEAPNGGSHAAGRWEQVKINWSRVAHKTVSEVEAALRAAIDFGWAVEHGAMRLCDAKVEADGTGTRRRLLSLPQHNSARLWQGSTRQPSSPTPPQIGRFVP